MAEFVSDSTKMDAVDILKTYAAFIREDVRAADFERHPYLPHIEQTIEDLRAATPAMDREAVETAIRIGVWNACADRGMSQETATAIVQAVVAQPIVTKALSTLSAYAIRQGEGKYLVWSNEHRAWWGPDHRGYTRAIERAGRYDRGEAFSIASKRGGGWEREANPDEIAIPEADAIAQYTRPRLATPAFHASDGGEA